MNRESQLVIDIWESVSDAIPPAKRLEAAVRILRAVEEYGFEIADLGHITDEDPLLAKAYLEVSPEDDDNDEPDYDGDDE